MLADLRCMLSFKIYDLRRQWKKRGPNRNLKFALKNIYHLFFSLRASALVVGFPSYNYSLGIWLAFDAYLDFFFNLVTQIYLTTEQFKKSV